jgi:hypothetical protein
MSKSSKESGFNDLLILGVSDTDRTTFDKIVDNVLSSVSTYSNTMSYMGIIVANMVMFFGWIIGIALMIYYYVIIATYKDDPNSGSKLFKTIYAICHCIISVLLLLYVFVRTCSFIKVKPRPVDPKDDTRSNMGGGSISDNSFDILVSFLIAIPINIREQIKNFLDKFNNLDYDGNVYITQINLSIMFKLVVAQFPIIIFLIVFTSIVSMIKAYQKILCGNANLDLIIDWPYRIIDIIMYAIFRIVGLFVTIMNFFHPESPQPVWMSIFYFTAIYLIIRFILLLYENLFSDTIVRLYKWDIRETDCGTNNSGETGNWILDPQKRVKVRNQQNLANSNKLTNDVFSLIFNILIILFLSGISIISVILLVMYSEEKALKLISIITHTIGYRTVTIEPASEADKAAADKAAATESAPSETAKY